MLAIRYEPFLRVARYVMSGESGSVVGNVWSVLALFVQLIIHFTMLMYGQYILVVTT
jgi:hypothetical protein